MKKKFSTILLVLLITVSTFAILGVPVSCQSAYLTEFIQLTTNPMRDRQPIWSPDGSQIAYFAFDSGGWYRHIWTMNPDGNGKTQLTFGNVVDETGDYSPDGTKIIFMRHRGGTTFDLMYLHLDSMVTETFLARGESLHMPRWSNNGDRIVFSLQRHSEGIYELHMIDVDGNNEETLVSSTYHPMTGYWSPDDSKILYTMNDGLWLVSTSPPYEKTRLFETSLEPVHCVYSPDGEYILYSARLLVEDYQDLYLADKDGNSIAQLTFDTSIGYPFEWSPDGQHIVFGSKRAGNEDIWRAKIIITGEQPQPDFEISVLPESDVADPHSLTDFEVTVESLNGFNEPVTLSAVYSSHELSGSFVDSVVTPPSDGEATTTLTVSVLSEAINTHQIYVTGTSGTFSHTDTASLQVPLLSVPFSNQGDTQWCGPTSIAMVMRFYGVSVQSWNVATELGLTHDDPFNPLLHYSTLRTYLEENDLTSELHFYPLSIDMIKDMLQESEPAILGFQFIPPDSVLPAGHAIVITGYYNDGTEDIFFVNDPGNVMHLLFGIGNYYGPNVQLEVPSSDLLPYVWDLFSYIIEIKGIPTPATGTLDLVGGKPEQAGSSFAFSHGTISPWSYDIYVWEQGKQGAHDTSGLSWKSKSPHPVSLDPEDYLSILNYPYGWIVNPTDKSRIYKFEMLFAKPGSAIPPIVVDVPNVGACSWANPNYPKTKIKDILGQNYGRYTITLKLTENNLLLDQIVLPAIKYVPAFKASVHSPADLFITDPLGRSIGVNPATGEIVNDIPDASFYSESSTEPQIVIIPDPINGTYSIILVGTATGNYSLIIEYITAEQTVTRNFNGTISEQEKQYYSALLTETGEMKTISWEYIFKDPRRGTTLKISTDDQLFQFIAPDKTFSVKYDPDMFVFKHMIFICYEDEELKLFTLTINTKIDFCIAYAQDMQTGNKYWLVDKPNWRGGGCGCFMK